MTREQTTVVDYLDTTLRTSNRRDFLRLIAMGGMATFLPIATGCGSDSMTDPLRNATFVMNTTSGPLNLIYAYSQFMADFYERCTRSTLVPPGRTSYERLAFSAIGSQKNTQMRTIRMLVKKDLISETLLFDFRSVAFLDQARILKTAQTFEDLGVAALNGLVPYLNNPKDLLLFAKIASNWARHSAVVRDLNYLRGNVATRTHFAADDVVDVATGLEKSIDLSTFVAEAQPYFVTKLSVK